MVSNKALLLGAAALVVFLFLRQDDDSGGIDPKPGEVSVAGCHHPSEVLVGEEFTAEVSVKNDTPNVVQDLGAFWQIEGTLSRAGLVGDVHPGETVTFSTDVIVEEDAPPAFGEPLPVNVGAEDQDRVYDERRCGTITIRRN